MHCRMFSSLPRIYSLDTSSIPIPSCGISKCPQTLPDVPLRAHLTHIENTDLERIHLYLNVHSKSIQGEKKLKSLLTFLYSYKLQYV